MDKKILRHIAFAGFVLAVINSAHAQGGEDCEKKCKCYRECNEMHWDEATLDLMCRENSCKNIKCSEDENSLLRRCQK